MESESRARWEQMAMKEWEVYRLGTTGRSVEKNRRRISRIRKKRKEGRAGAEEGTKRRKRRGEERRKRR